VSITTVRLTPSASGLAQTDFAGCGAGAGAGGVAGFEDSDAVTSTSSFVLAAGAGKGSALRAAIVMGAAASARGEEVQNQIPAIAIAATTLASIRPNALRIATLPKYARNTQATRH
jgi:hypothetical protein